MRDDGREMRDVMRKAKRQTLNTKMHHLRLHLKWCIMKRQMLMRAVAAAIAVVVGLGPAFACPVRAESLYKAAPKGEILGAVHFSAMADFGNKYICGLPVKDYSVVSGLKTIGWDRTAYNAFGKNQRIWLSEIVLKLMYNPLLDILWQLAKHAFALAGKVVGNHLRPSLFLTSLPETRPDLRDASSEARNSGEEASISSSISSMAFVSNSRPSVRPFLSTMRTMPFKANGNFAASDASNRTIFSSDKPFNSGGNIFSPPVCIKYNTLFLTLSRLFSIREQGWDTR